MPDGPGRPSGVAPAKIEVAAGIDRKVLERRELARREIDRQALGDRAEIEDQRPAAA